ncbi:MAG TPA: alpha-N-arabinofuranosidase, partial [Clostridia bacterium]|nr:alpha-N-arabinofuranosidase [Clostridia bacterium]
MGPLHERKKKRNVIWGGVNDGVGYCRALGAEPMICVNMASGTPQEAADWVEYCNGAAGSYFADLRIAHGWPEPFNVKYWCIGNESQAVPDLGPQHNPDRYIAD